MLKMNERNYYLFLLISLEFQSNYTTFAATNGEENHENKDILYNHPSGCGS